MLRPFLGSTILRSPDPDPAGGGGGGDPDTSKTGGFSKEQLDFFGGIVNAAVTSHLKRLPNLADQLKTVAWDDILTPVVQKLVPQPDPDGKPKGAKGESSEYEKQLKKLSDDLEASNKRGAESEQRRVAAETARRVDGAKLKLRSALQGKVNDFALDHAINHLTLVQNRLSVDENGNATLKVKRPEFIGGPSIETDVSLEDAIKDILEESDMKVFLPVPQGGGKSPGPRGANGQPISFVGEAKTEAEKLARAAVREQEVLAKYGNR